MPDQRVQEGGEAVNPRTPAEALRWAAWLTLERGATYAQEAITPPPVMSECTAYEYALTCEVRADTLEDAAEAMLAEAERLEALEAQSAELTDEDVDLIETIVDSAVEVECFDIGASGVGADYRGHDMPKLVRDLTSSFTITRKANP